MFSKKIMVSITVGLLLTIPILSIADSSTKQEEQVVDTVVLENDIVVEQKQEDVVVIEKDAKLIEEKMQDLASKSGKILNSKDTLKYLEDEYLSGTLMLLGTHESLKSTTGIIKGYKASADGTHGDTLLVKTLDKTYPLNLYMYNKILQNKALVYDGGVLTTIGLESNLQDTDSFTQPNDVEDKMYVKEASKYLVIPVKNTEGIVLGYAFLEGKPDGIDTLSANADSLELKDVKKQDTLVKKPAFLSEKEGTLAYRHELLRFQANYNLDVDGSIGPKTQEVLYSDLEAVDIITNAPSKGYWITVNLDKKILTVYEGTKVYKKYPVAVGKKGSETPEGKTKIVSKVVNPAWGGMGGKYKPVRGGVPENPLGYRWMGLSTNIGSGYGIHGNNDEWSIGKYISAGCIRMINADSKDLYSYIPKSAPVWIGKDATLQKWGVTQEIR